LKATIIIPDVGREAQEPRWDLQQHDRDRCLLYEEKPEGPLEDIKACLAEARKAIAAIGPA
jgi:hypothetical protein